MRKVTHVTPISNKQLTAYGYKIK